MAVAGIQPSFAAGELSPGLFGRSDLARFHTGAATMRNLFVSYRGGAYSRAGTAFVGFSKQTGRAFPPWLVPFQFSINQGLALEFGNFYMRVVSDGGFVLEPALPIASFVGGDPPTIGVNASGVASATPIDAGVTSTYAPADLVTVAGGTPITPAVLRVTNTKLLSLALNSPGTSGYVPTNTINLAGGTQSTTAVLTVSTTQVVSATIAAAGTFTGTSGTYTVVGTTGTGTMFQASCTLTNGSGITAVLSITLGGSYTANPTTLTAEPVTATSLTGGELAVLMGVNTFAIFNAGIFTANPAGGLLTQASSSGSGVGASFKTALLGPNAVTVATAGNYASPPPSPAQQASTTGTGIGATFALTFASSTPYNPGDWLYVSGITITGIPPQLTAAQYNGRIVVVGTVNGAKFTIFDVYGNPINAAAVTWPGGGTVARVFTLTTIWGEQDLPYLKVTESADVMSICCVNQQTGKEYPPQDLTRLSDTSWTLTPVVPAPTIAPPASCAVTSTSASGTARAYYEYAVTAVNPGDGTESIASPIGAETDGVDIASEAGTITVTWPTVAGSNQSNVYKATPGVASTGSGQPAPPVGALLGYAGTSYGNSFSDTNIIPDFSQVPPTHQNPFAPGQVIAVLPGTGGSGFTQAGITYAITTATGSGFAGTPIVSNGGAFVGFVVVDPGQDYLATDTIAIGGNGTGATASLQVGPENGNFPSVPAYFQERRVYASSLNNPDTYWMSQPGAFTNFDARTPPIDSDAITGSPWAVEVNGIQYMLPMPGGLLVLTGLSAWLLGGSGSAGLSLAPITPASQDAQPQAYNGCAQNVPPFKIDYDVIYLQSKGSIYRRFNFNLYANIYTGEDITINSSHLFTGYQVVSHAWAEEPYKVLWAVRDDGVLLSATINKPQEVLGWGRHDTAGTFQSVCSVAEPPVDAVYLATQRTIGTNPPCYMIERMDNRLWPSAEASWCVDAGVALTQLQPAATLGASSASGLGSISGFTGLVGGSNYSAQTVFTVVDLGPRNNGQGRGTGATVTATIANGVVTNLSFPTAGQNYYYPQVNAFDPSNQGSGFAAKPTLNNTMTFTASANIFAAGNVGNVIRMGGGIATITAVAAPNSVTANMMSPITQTTAAGVPLPAAAGNWTMTAPVTTVGGLYYLAGASVTGLADGNVIAPVTVPSTGIVTLATAASAVTIGLGYTCQLQSMYLEAGEPTEQGQRKKIGAVTVRLEASRAVRAGTNQPDGSTQSPVEIAPPWYEGAGGLAIVPDQGPNFPLPPYNALATPLRTGDIRIAVGGGWQAPGQVALEQDSPLPMNILALVNERLPGDVPQLQAPRKEK
jgi:hypothetical protein